MASRWLARDLNKLKRDPLPGIDGGPRGDDMFLWDCTISGPPETPWEGALLSDNFNHWYTKPGTSYFQLTIHFPHDYPLKPPDVRFTSRIFHPNVYPDGRICMDLLAEQWSPAGSPVQKILLSIQSILDSPNVEDPANPEAAKLYCIDRRQYNRKVRAISAATWHRIKDQLSSENGESNSEHPENLNQAGPSNEADDLDSDFGLNSEHPDNLNQAAGPSNRANDLASDCGDGPASTSSARQERSQCATRSWIFMRCFGCSKS